MQRKSSLLTGLAALLLIFQAACGELGPEKMAAQGMVTAVDTLQPALLDQTATPPLLDPASKSIRPISTESSSSWPTRTPDCMELPNSLLSPLPDPSDFRWEMVDGLRSLIGLTRPVKSASPSPDGRWWLVSLPHQRGDSWSNSSSLYMVDTLASEHWLVAPSANQQDHTSSWLPDSRLIWVDQDRLYLAGAGGQGKHDLHAPEPVAEVWTSGSQALVSGKTNLWRLDLTNEVWEPVSGLDRLATAGQWPVSRLQANLSIALDSKYGLLFAGGELWQVPLEPGKAAIKMGEITTPGSDWRVGAPQALTNSPYWFPGETWIDNHTGQIELVLLNTRDGSLLPLQSLVSPNLIRVTDIQISPGGRWFALINTDATHAKSIYLAAASSPKAGRVTSGISVVGWNEPTSTALILDDLSEIELKQIDLVSGNETLVDTFPRNLYLSGPVTMPQGLLMMEGSQVKLLLEGGELQDLGLLPVSLSRLDIFAAGPTGQALFAGISAGQTASGCQVDYRLIVAEPDTWQMIPPTPAPPTPVFRTHQPGDSAPSAVPVQ